jgi:hypothetical protein
MDYEVDTIRITNNDILNLNYGIRITNEHAYERPVFLLIDGNRLTGTSEVGIYLTQRYTYLYSIMLSNNYIHVTGSGFVKGIWTEGQSSSNPLRLLNNSINVTSTHPLSSSLYLLTEINSIEVKNNIFSNPGGGYAAFLQTLLANSSWDFNNYYAPTGKIGSLNGTTYTTLPSWAAAINGEANGKESNPFFTSATDLKPNQIVLNETGITLSECLYDIDSTLRNDLVSDIGAKEFSPCLLDAGIDNISFPANPILPGNQPVKVFIRNQGLTTITSAMIYWQINDQPFSPFQWNGILSSGQSVEITLGTYNFPGTSYSGIKAWTTLPNNQTDCNQFNDTAVSANLAPALCGMYTVGGLNPDFATLNEAVSFLNSSGVSCPVFLRFGMGFTMSGSS